MQGFQTTISHEVMGGLGVCSELVLLDAEHCVHELVALRRFGPPGIETRHDQIHDLAAVRPPRDDVEEVPEKIRNFLRADSFRRIVDLDRKLKRGPYLGGGGDHIEDRLGEPKPICRPSIAGRAHEFIYVNGSSGLESKHQSAEEPLEGRDVMERCLKEDDVINPAPKRGIVEVAELII